MMKPPQLQCHFIVAMRNRPVVAAFREPARGCPARSTSLAGRFSEFERAFRRAAAATETVARRFMVPMRGHKTVEATHEPAKALVQPFVAYATKGCPDRLIVIDL